MNKLLMFTSCVVVVLLVFTTSSCYKEQHFKFPGPFEDTASKGGIDSLPFPFDENRQAGVWLMKDGAPYYDKILFKGFTDYRPMHDTVSWVQESNAMRLIPHRNYYPLTDADHLGGDPNSFRYNWVSSKYFVPIGAGKSFYMYVKFSVGTFSGTAAGLLLGRSWETGGDFLFGFDGNSNVAPTFFVDLYGKTGISVNPANGWPTVNEVIVPGLPAEWEVVIHDNVFYTKVNGVLCFYFKVPSEALYYFTPAIRPWRNFVAVHDFYIESSDMYTVEYVMHEYEQGYTRIQHPALAKAPNNDLLLFAEGRSNPASAYERVAQHTLPVGNTDIIMKRSEDGGDTWSEQISVVVGDGTDKTYGFPQVITTNSGKMILHYSELSPSLSNNTYTYPPSDQKRMQIVSTDNGRTWSQPVDITSSLQDEASGYLKSTSGHGIELKSADYRDRLVMPIVYGDRIVRVALSDDEGNTWYQSDKVTGANNINSAAVVELSTGQLMLILSHTNTSPQSRYISYSNDGGQTWSAVVPASTVGINTATYGHMYDGVLAKHDNQIYYVSPVDREKDAQVYNGPTYGVSPTLFVSSNDGSTFQRMGPLFTKIAYRDYFAPVGKMDAVVNSNGKLIIVTEGGVDSPQEGIVIYRQ